MESGAGFNIPTKDELERMKVVVFVVGFTIIASWGLAQAVWWRIFHNMEKHLEYLQRMKEKQIDGNSNTPDDGRK